MDRSVDQLASGHAVLMHYEKVDCSSTWPKLFPNIDDNLYCSRACWLTNFNLDH